MVSQVDVTVPVFGTPTTQSVRDNMVIIANEISQLQTQVAGNPFLPLAGGRMTGPMYLFNDPTDAMMPATKGYVDVHGGGGGGGGIPEAPADGGTYGRYNGAWRPALPIAGGTLTGPLVLAGDPTAPLGAATMEWVQAQIATTLPDAPNDATFYGRHGGAWANVLGLAGGTMLGLLTLSGPPTAALHAATKAYADTMLPLAGGRATGMVYIGPTAPVIPSDASAVVISGVEYSARQGGHYAINSYVPTPGTNWKYLEAGPAAQFWQNTASPYNAIISVWPNGAAGGVATGGASYTFSPTGNFVASGRVTGTGVACNGVVYISTDANFYMQDVSPNRIIAFLPSWYVNYATGDGTWQVIGTSGAIWTMKGLTAPSWNCFASLGPVGGNGAYYLVSDERAKADMQLAPHGLAEVLAIEPIVFRRIRRASGIGEHDERHTFIDEREELGFSAQQLRGVLPHAVRQSEIRLPDDTDDSLATEDTPILAAVVNALKTIDARLRSLETKYDTDTHAG